MSSTTKNRPVTRPAEAPQTPAKATTHLSRGYVPPPNSRPQQSLHAAVEEQRYHTGAQLQQLLIDRARGREIDISEVSRLAAAMNWDRGDLERAEARAESIWRTLQECGTNAENAAATKAAKDAESAAAATEKRLWPKIEAMEKEIEDARATASAAANVLKRIAEARDRLSRQLPPNVKDMLSAKKHDYTVRFGGRISNIESRLKSIDGILELPAIPNNASYACPVLEFVGNMPMHQRPDYLRPKVGVSTPGGSRMNSREVSPAAWTKYRDELTKERGELTAELDTLKREAEPHRLAIDEPMRAWTEKMLADAPATTTAAT